MPPVGADSNEVGAFCKHDETVSVGRKPSVVGGDRGGGAYEDVFAGPTVLKFSEASTVARRFFVFDWRGVGEKSDGCHVDGMTVGSGGEPFLHGEESESKEGAEFVEMF